MQSARNPRATSYRRIGLGAALLAVLIILNFLRQYVYVGAPVKTPISAEETRALNLQLHLRGDDGRSAGGPRDSDATTSSLQQSYGALDGDSNYDVSESDDVDDEITLGPDIDYHSDDNTGREPFPVVGLPATTPATSPASSTRGTVTDAVHSASLMATLNSLESRLSELARRLADDARNQSHAAPPGGKYLHQVLVPQSNANNNDKTATAADAERKQSDQAWWSGSLLLRERLKHVTSRMRSGAATASGTDTTDGSARNQRQPELSEASFRHRSTVVTLGTEVIAVNSGELVLQGS